VAELRETNIMAGGVRGSATGSEVNMTLQYLSCHCNNANGDVFTLIILYDLGNMESN
jgi:hypothetical protein